MSSAEGIAASTAPPLLPEQIQQIQQQQQQQAVQRPPNLVIGLSIPQSKDAAQLLQSARNDGYDYVTTCLPTPTVTPAAAAASGGGSGSGSNNNTNNPAAIVAGGTSSLRTDITALESQWWRSSIVGMVEASTTMTTSSSSSSSAMADRWLDGLDLSIGWASHMHIPAVMLPPLPVLAQSSSIVQFAPQLQQLCATAQQQSQTQIWISTRLDAYELQQIDRLFRLCDAPPNLGIIVWMTKVPTIHGASHNNQQQQQQSSSLSTSAPSPTAHVASQIILLHRAMALQLKAICFPTTIFLTNKRGYPTLAKSHQLLFTEVLRRLGRTLRVLIHGPSVHPTTLSGASKCLPYLQYMRHMRNRPEVTALLDGEEASLEEGYLDQLQRPLQPLGDHLDFGTYETFERDPVKYARYQQAILYCLRDGWLSLEHKGSTIVTIVVAGAGRGPLVQCALRALQELPTLPEFNTTSSSSSSNSSPPIPPPQLSLKIFAVEKNPHAVLFLQSMVEFDPTWRHVVTVVPKDMRHVTLKDLDQFRADIVVSELLGSFGDNELSPECLRGFAQTGPADKNSILKKTTIFIPSSYTSHLAPISSYRLWTEAKALTHSNIMSSNGSGSADASIAAMETPYVTRTHAASQTHPEQDVWSFVHPHDHAAPSLERYARLRFGPTVTHGAGFGSGYGAVDVSVTKMACSIFSNTTSSMQDDTALLYDPVLQREAWTEVEQWQGVGSNATTIHGFVGTFTAVLYTPSSLNNNNNSSSNSNVVVEISTAPSRFSVGMYSWFPLWFPLHQPLHVPSGATVQVDLWRKARDEQRVWYEWCAQVITLTSNNDEGIPSSSSSSTTDMVEQVLAVTPIHNPNGRSSHVSML